MSQSQANETSDPVQALALTLRAASVRGAKHSKEQKQFNKLVKDIHALRTALAQWQEFLPALRHRVMTEIEPLTARYREHRVQLVMLFHRAIDSKELGRRHKTKAVEILRWHLSEILANGPDPELIALYDQYAEVSFAEEQAMGAELLRSMAGEVFGIEFDEGDDAQALTEEQLARVIAEKLEAEYESQAGRSRARHKKSAKAQAQEALHQQLAHSASDAVREIYRKLASELHPDRELDADQRTRKTTLMQQANQAYAASDLLTLLGMQLQLEQLDPTTLSSLARERLLQYNHVLADQCQQLRTELADLTAPFAMSIEDSARQLTPAAVERALDREARDLKHAAKDCAADVAHLHDMRNIKDALNDYQLGDLATDYSSSLDDLFLEIPPPSRRGRRR